MSEWWFDGPPDAHWTLLLAHGAGAGSESPFMDDLAGRLGDAGLRVVRFDFPYMRRMREEGRRRPPEPVPRLCQAYAETVTRLCAGGVARERLLIGGKSLGGRIASLIADDQQVAGLVCLGYPFHPPRKPDKPRTGHLATLHTPALICQGERDAFGDRDDVAGYLLATGTVVHWLADGDHGFKPRKTSGHTEDGNRARAVQLVVDFVASLG